MLRLRIHITVMNIAILVLLVEKQSQEIAKVHWKRTYVVVY